MYEQSIKSLKISADKVLEKERELSELKNQLQRQWSMQSSWPLGDFFLDLTIIIFLPKIFLLPNA